MKKKVVGRPSMRRRGWWSALRYAGFASMLWAGIALGAASAATSGFVVDEDGRDCPARTHHSIQQAVDDAIAQAIARSESEVALIRVCPGSYRERVRIHAPQWICSHDTGHIWEAISPQPVLTWFMCLQKEFERPAGNHPTMGLQSRVRLEMVDIPIEACQQCHWDPEIDDR